MVKNMVWKNNQPDCFGTSDFRLMTSDWVQSTRFTHRAVMLWGATHPLRSDGRRGSGSC